MKDQFVPYEIAKMLKELSFNEECIAWYNDMDLIFVLDDKTIDSEEHKFNSLLSKFIYANKISAPLWQQAEEWLWEAYVINIAIKRIEGYKYSWSVYNGGQGLIANEAGRCEGTPILAKRKAILETIKYFHKRMSLPITPNEVQK